jgi:uncharacterized RDD family membrane protein YckC
MDNVIDDLVKMCIERLQKDDCRDLDPIAAYIGKQVWPYIIVASVLFIIALILLILIFSFILYYNHLTKLTLCDRSR